MTARPKYVGNSVKRREDPRLLRGRGRYVGDIKLPGMLYMALVRSPMAHARITGVDTSRALALRGVLAAIAYDDIRGEVNPLPMSERGDVAGETDPVAEGVHVSPSTSIGPIACIDLMPDSTAVLQTVLADGKVRYVGEPVVAVVATDPYLAEDALELVDVDYEPLEPVVDLLAAVRDDAPLLYEELGSNVFTTIHQDVGDVDAAFAAADRSYAETFRIHRYAPVPMETRGVVADADPVERRVTLYSSTQFPHLARGFLAGALDMPESRIRVVAPDVGGGFGAKCEFYPEEVLAPLLSLRLGRPVKWIEDRREHMIASTHAREQIHEVEAAVDAEGNVTAVRARSHTNNGAAASTLAITPTSIFSAMLRGPYRIPNYRVEAKAVFTNKTPLAVYRGAGHPQAAFCMERMMDIIARDLGVDRAEFRRRNMLTSEELPSDRGTEIVLAGKVVYDSGDYPRCLDMALEMMDYGGFLGEQQSARAEGRHLGLGICAYVEETAIGPYESATVRVDGAGKVTVLTGSCPQGQGHVTAFSQLVADEFDIDLDDVTVLYGDTDVVADGVGTFASRSGAIGGAAARQAAAKVRMKAMELAGHMLEVDVSDLEWTDGGAHVRGVPDKRLELGELATRATAWNTDLPEGMSFNLDGTHHHQAPGIAFGNATHIAVVEVDARTGKVDILRYGVVHDCGTVINPQIVDGQVHGGVVQGLGGTMLEELVYDQDGQPLSTSFADYLLPTAGEVPHIQTEHLEIPTPLNPYGMKGAGEGGAVGSPGAIVNAIADALAPLGVRLTTDGPYSPSRVLELIDGARAAR
jgi:carbon-monoxide dehydrogenase large subunit